MTKKKLISILVIISSLLSIQFIAMQFTNEVNWKTFDFIIMGTLLLFLSFTIEFIIRKTKNVKPRLLLIASVLVLFLLICAELAVGIIGSPLAGS